MEGTARYPAGDKPVQWVSPAWLQDHLDDRMLIVDTQPDVHEYIRGHIPARSMRTRACSECMSTGIRPAGSLPG